MSRNDPIETPPRVRCLGREGDHAHYLAAASGGGEPYPVTLDLADHTSACECRAAFVGRYLCKHQRAAIADWYGRRARIKVAEDSDATLAERDRDNRRQLAKYVAQGTRAREAGQYERAVRFDGYALRCQLMLDAIGDEVGNRAGFLELARAS